MVPTKRYTMFKFSISNYLGLGGFVLLLRTIQRSELDHNCHRGRMTTRLQDACCWTTSLTVLTKSRRNHQTIQPQLSQPSKVGHKLDHCLRLAWRPAYYPHVFPSSFHACISPIPNCVYPSIVLVTESWKRACCNMIHGAEIFMVLSVGSCTKCSLGKHVVQASRGIGFFGANCAGCCWIKVIQLFIEVCISSALFDTLIQSLVRWHSWI